MTIEEAIEEAKRPRRPLHAQRRHAMTDAVEAIAEVRGEKGVGP